MDTVFVPGRGRLPMTPRPAPPTVDEAKRHHAEVAQALEAAEEALRALDREIQAYEVQRAHLEARRAKAEEQRGKALEAFQRSLEGLRAARGREP